MRRLLRTIAAGALFAWVGAGTARAAELELKAPRAEVPSGRETVVGLHARVDVETSALQGGVAYDAALFEVLEVTAGSALPKGARADFNADEPGWLRLGFVCSPSEAAFRGSGEVLRMKVRARGAVGAEGALRLGQVRAWEPNDTELRALAVDGTLRIVPAPTTPWAVIAAVALGVLLLLALLARRRRRPALAPAAARSAPRPPAARAREAAPGGRGRFCTSCGAATPKEGARFCAECGSPLA